MRPGGKEIGVLSGHRGELLNLRFSSQGNLLLSRGNDETLRVWDVTSGSEVRRAVVESGPTGERFSLSLDERLLAWAEAHDDAIHLWDLAARKEIR